MAVQSRTLVLRVSFLLPWDCMPFIASRETEIHAWISDPLFSSCRDQKGIMKRVGELAEENDVSIHAVLQTHIEDTTKASFVITTHPCK